PVWPRVRRLGVHRRRADRSAAASPWPAERLGAPPEPVGASTRTVPGWPAAGWGGAGPQHWGGEPRTRGRGGGGRPGPVGAAAARSGRWGPVAGTPDRPVAATERWSAAGALGPRGGRARPV